MFFLLFKSFFQNPNFGGSYLEIGKKITQGFVSPCHTCEIVILGRGFLVVQGLKFGFETVNTSGKAGAQIPHPPWEMIHLPGGDNTVSI
jgi:hypothetical protein